MKYFVNLFLIINVAVAIIGCNKVKYDYPGGTPSDIISCLDVRQLYKEQDLVLSKENMYGASKLAAVVISDHTEKNLPQDLLVVQDSRRLQTLRGISVEVGAAVAAKYHSGDSVLIEIAGSTLTRKNGILTITGVTEANITATGKGVVSLNDITIAQLNAHPELYESSLCVINKSSFNPAPKTGEVIAGNKVINDGLGDLALYTNPGSSYANNAPYALAGYVGIPFRTADGPVDYRTRNGDDIINMGSSAQELLISGFMGDPKGADAGYEYVQMIATKDINFATTPYSIVFCANAGGNITATPLAAGWATGGQRTIKWNITKGGVKKGQYFYFAFQNKKISGSGGVDTFPSTTNLYQKTYNATGDGGLAKASAFSTSSGPFPNTGNMCGVALFKGTTVKETSVPEDVLFVATGGGADIYNSAKNPILGYRICNNDWYSMYSVTIDAATYKPIIIPYLYYRSTGNTTNMPYAVNAAHPTLQADASLFNMMGGVYSISLGRWTTARKQVVVELTPATATLNDIETNASVTKLVE
jgi:hypothetical protein